MRLFIILISNFGDRLLTCELDSTYHRSGNFCVMHFFPVGSGHPRKKNLHVKNGNNFLNAYIFYTRKQYWHRRWSTSTEEPAVFVVAYLLILAERPTLYFLYGALIGFWSSRLACAIAVEGTEVESALVGLGSRSFSLKKLNKDTSLTLNHACTQRTECPLI